MVVLGTGLNVAHYEISANSRETPAVETQKEAKEDVKEA